MNEFLYSDLITNIRCHKWYIKYLLNDMAASDFSKENLNLSILSSASPFSLELSK